MPSWKTPDGLEIFYNLFGREDGGRVLVFLNGLLGSSETHWRQFIDPLAKEFTLLTFDFRGHGRSETTGPRLWLNNLVEDFVGLLDFLNLSAVSVSGYSIGGYVGLQTALQFPARIKTLHLHSTKAAWSPEALERVRPQLDPDHLTAQAPNFATQLAQEHGASRWRALARESIDLLAEISQNPLPDHALSQIRPPVLVSVGDRDEVVSIPDAARLAFRLRDGGLLVLPRTRRPLTTVGLTPLVPMMTKFHQQDD